MTWVTASASRSGSMEGEDDATTPSTPGTDEDPSARVCEQCETAIDTSDWYPVTNDRDADGTLRLYHFCSEECQDAWLGETAE